LRKGRGVAKASHLCRVWRRRLHQAGDTSGRVHAVVGYAQEVAPAIWRRARAVLACVDHPRARFDVAMLARRYEKPLLMAAFDARAATACLEYFPAARDAACFACALGSEPTYAASEGGCSATALRLLEARKLPATPNLSTASAALMAQALVDGLSEGFSETANVLRIGLSARPSSTAGPFTIDRDPGCPRHDKLPRVRARLHGRTLGSVLRDLEKRVPGCRLELAGLLPIYALDGSGSKLVTAALPPWRCSPAAIANFAPAPLHASPLALDYMNATLAKRFGLARLPSRWFGAGRGAVVVVVKESGERLEVVDDGTGER
jgi:hypothetical protein